MKLNKHTFIHDEELYVSDEGKELFRVYKKDFHKGRVPYHYYTDFGIHDGFGNIFCAVTNEELLKEVEETLVHDVCYCFEVEILCVPSHDTSFATTVTFAMVKGIDNGQTYILANSIKDLCGLWMMGKLNDLQFEGT